MKMDSIKIIKDNIDLDKKIDDLENKLDEIFSRIDQIDPGVIEKKEHDVLVDLQKYKPELNH